VQYNDKNYVGKVIKMLVERGADVNAVDESGNSALFYMVAAHHRDYRELSNAIALFKDKVKSDVRGAQNATLLMVAIKNDSYESGEILEFCNGFKFTDINAVDANGDTALMYALRRSYSPHPHPETCAIVDFLIKLGANTCTVNKRNETAVTTWLNEINGKRYSSTGTINDTTIEYALVIITRLIASNAQVDTVDKNKTTVLITIVKKFMTTKNKNNITRCENLVKELLMRGANASVVDVYGNTAMTYAKLAPPENAKEIIRLLSAKVAPPNDEIAELQRAVKQLMCTNQALNARLAELEAKVASMTTK